MSPDWSASPEPVPYAKLDEPQSLNLYTYVKNNPVTHTDSDGHCDVEGINHKWIWCTLHSVGAIQTEKKKRAQKLAQQQAAQAAWQRFHANHPGRSYTQYRLLLSMATSMPGPSELSLAGDGAEALSAAAGAGEDMAETAQSSVVHAHKLFHIFGNAQHNLGSLVAKFGSKESAYKAPQEATEAAVKAQGITGVFEKTVQVAGETVTVRGIVIDGAVKIGTAFK